ncbi:hypothetical protein CLU79DRAFT_848974 [Phycomyces nitens]|nr:hypothetical protein CLU79DRAFT_848974 [Phycomyces nitens]
MNTAFQYTHCGPIIVPVFCLTGEYTTYFCKLRRKFLYFTSHPVSQCGLSTVEGTSVGHFKKHALLATPAGLFYITGGCDVHFLETQATVLSFSILAISLGSVTHFMVVGS